MRQMALEMQPRSQDLSLRFKVLGTRLSRNDDDDDDDEERKKVKSISC